MERYVIRGGRWGAERLQVLARAWETTTADLLDRAGVGLGQHCVDLGCGGGDVTLELARRVGPHGSVAGIDMDDGVLAVAAERVAAAGLDNVTFRTMSVYEWSEAESYDVAYCRNLVQHLGRPIEVIRAMWDAVRPGGVLVVEDADFEGAFCFPPNDGFTFWVEKYQQVLRSHGGDPLSGRKLYARFAEAGIPAPEVRMVQRADVAGEAKTLPYLTIAGTASAIIEHGLATEAEVDAALQHLERFANDPMTTCGSPRIFQVFTRKPSRLSNPSSGGRALG
jgi:ubiquinone/menaquinone biosynthesis C-methylase UbiE